MKIKELNQHYYNLLTDLEKVSTTIDDTDELSILIFSSEWVKFYLIGNILTKKVSIHVEISYSDFSQINKNQIHLALKNQIVYLQYLLKLYTNGFTLDIVAEEAIWFAMKDLESQPSKDLVDLLFHFQIDKK